nr:hypothetical protein [Moraxella osloensis]
MFTSLFQLEQKPVTVFSASDAGAPTLTAGIGSLKTLLKACLVTGYGSKQGLGWQMAFESTDKNSAAFKSADPTASGFYFKIDNSTTDTAKLSAYQEMTDISTGMKPFVVNQTYDLAASNWMLVGHSKAFILLLDINVSNDKVAYPIIFGDLPREKKQVAPVCLLWMGHKNLTNAGGLQATMYYPNGNTGGNTNGGMQHAPTRPMYTNEGSASARITNTACRFSHASYISASVLFEPVLIQLPSSTWSFLPMLQPLSTPLNDVANLGLITATTVKAKTGRNGGAGQDNQDCAVPLDWWYA